ncbi:hypothetical protein ACIQVR_39475 [Streptomyces xanthochromogenes]|uniref:hypothetical protein n=1 Tax=Streptomyces xanthochromogenes TaxID=67384 RepID=UPI0037F7E4C1
MTDRVSLATFLPLSTAQDGQPYISCAAVVALLEHCAVTIAATGLDADAAASLLDDEAEVLNLRAIGQTATP